ncbi:hypothetical protein [Actinacidiphila bryophytorum]|uniref:hypothetical protein n=1 Tax=Actinacidiphila bryophytorum TaxID=1436133 RepID=UPI002176B3DD|nr:hypothetical protein [Actinacidiphila bryophytorum]UWE09351.1 hypothetical protein NYE86_11850 [Actinacidiphila bryophytorum]
MAAVERAEPPAGAGIVDLSGVPLERLRTLDYPDVSESLERLLGDLDDPHSVRAGGSNPSHAE